MGQHHGFPQPFSGSNFPKTIVPWWWWSNYAHTMVNIRLLSKALGHVCHLIVLAINENHRIQSNKAWDSFVCDLCRRNAHWLRESIDNLVFLSPSLLNNNALATSADILYNQYLNGHYCCWALKKMRSRVRRISWRLFLSTSLILGGWGILLKPVLGILTIFGRFWGQMSFLLHRLSGYRDHPGWGIQAGI